MNHRPRPRRKYAASRLALDVLVILALSPVIVVGTALLVVVDALERGR